MKKELISLEKHSSFYQLFYKNRKNDEQEIDTIDLKTESKNFENSIKAEIDNSSIYKDIEREEFIKEIEKDDTILEKLSLHRLKILKQYYKKRVEEKEKILKKLQDANF